MAQVAKRANVSITTASAVMRGTGRVSDQTRQRVLGVASAIGYRKHAGAVALRTGHNGVLGVVMEPGTFEDNPAHPKLFWPRLLNGLFQRLVEGGIGMALVSPTRPEPMAAFPLDALLLLGDPAHTLLFDIPFGMPVIGGIRGASGVSASAGHDFARIARDCADHLRAQGSSQVVLVTTQDSIPTNELVIRAFQQALAGEGGGEAKHPSPLIVPPTREAVREAVSRGADTFVCLGENLDGLLAEVRERGLTIPNEVMVLSLSEGDRERVLDPTVSGVSFLGHESGKMLGDMIVAGIGSGRFESITLPHEFTQRASTSRR